MPKQFSSLFLLAFERGSRETAYRAIFTRAVLAVQVWWPKSASKEGLFTFEAETVFLHILPRI
jgi:hypothetical protein